MIRIENVVRNDGIAFEELNVGDTFMLGGSYYLKVKPVVDINCVNLETGLFDNIRTKQKVEEVLINATVEKAVL